MNVIKKFGLPVLIASTTALTLQSFPIEKVDAAQVVSKAATPTLKTVKINASTTAKVTDIQMMYGSNEKTVYYTVAIYNGSNQDLDFGDYWVELYSKSGSKFTSKLDANDAKDTKIPAKTTKEFHFSAKVNYGLTINNIKIKFLKWDFSQPDYIRSLGEVSIPSNYSNVVPSATGKVVKIGGKQMSSMLAKSEFAVIGGQVEGSLTYRVTNYSNQAIALNNINFYIKRSGGTMNKLNVDLGGEQQLLSGAAKELQLYGTLPINKIDPNMQLIVTVTDEETKTEMPLATYAITPVGQQWVYTPVNKERAITIDGTKVNSKLRDAFVSTTGTTQQVSMYMSFANKGKQAVSLPNYSYLLMTADGTLYPQVTTTTNAATSTELLPGLLAEKYLQFNVPSSAKMSGLRLVVRQTSEENKKGFVKGLYNVPTTQNQQNVRTVRYNSKQGLFNITVERGERLPWGTQDIINSIITISNTEGGMKSLPNLKATVMLNGYQVDEKDIQLIKTDNIISLDSNQSTNYILSAKVPYTFKSSALTIQLSEVTDSAAGAQSSIGQFNISSTSLTPPAIGLTESIRIAGVGRAATLKLVNRAIYEKKDSKMAYVEFEYNNDEKRIADLANLQVFFQTKDGNYTQGTFVNVKSKASAGRNSLVQAYVVLPSNTDTSELKVLVGEGITGNTFTPADGTADGFVNAKSYTLPMTNMTAPVTFQNMALNPYRINIKNWSTYQTDSHEYKFEFTYDLSRLYNYEYLAGGHKLVIQLVDGSKEYEKAFELETGTDAWKLGEGIKTSVTFSDEPLWGLLFRDFTVNIYDEYQGHRKLMASQKLSATTTNQ
ncbi:hypothetical protein [Paenibacillus methanolicus]|uniref:Uncharacterized protein n=1 Tax=Paenibacillus methanolicus TaxID=582686 RepID=A0A5S5C8P0_9BACL|nr:hypothetical protein [Paenibacillus methanolicus]TYP75704.1 hypothetical protein BCM02_104385 [Paenibacillus methanolicus]